MANFKVNNVPSWVQYTATNGQTQFSIPFPFINDSDLSVWKNDVLLVLTTNYTLTGAQTTSGGQLTLNIGAAVNDKITIQDLMSIDRTNIYLPVISALTGSALNNDFNRDVIMIRDTTTTVDYLMLQYEPYSDISQNINDTTDRRLPILPPLSTWQKNAGNTEIVAVSLPVAVVGVNGVFTDDNRITTTDIPSGNNYIKQTDIQVVGDTVTSVSGNLVLTGTNNVNITTPGQANLLAGTTLSLQGVTWPTTAPAVGQSPYAINSTLLGWNYTADSTDIQDNLFIYANDTGAVDTFEIALTPPITAYTAGQTFYFLAANTNSGASTLNVDGLGAVDLRKNYNAALASGDILAGQVVQVTYDGVRFQMESPVANSVSGGGVNPGTINHAAYYASTGSTISETDMITFNPQIGSVNILLVTDAVTGSPPSIAADGTDIDIGLDLSSKGVGEVNLMQDNGTPIVSGVPTASSVNYVSVHNSATGQAPFIGADGSDANITIGLQSKGSGNVHIGNELFTTLLVAAPVASQVNYLVNYGTATGGSPRIEVGGTDANVNLVLQAKAIGGVYLFDGYGPISTFLSYGGVAPVNYIQHYNAPTGLNPLINAVGTDANVKLQLSGKGTAGVLVEGTGTNDSAPAGYVGEYLSAERTYAARINLVSAATTNITSIVLTPGDWDVDGNVFLEGLTNNIRAGVSSINIAVVFPGVNLGNVWNSGATSLVQLSLPTPTYRISAFAPVTFYLLGQGNFSAGTVQCSGIIRARRVR